MHTATHLRIRRLLLVGSAAILPPAWAGCGPSVWVDARERFDLSADGVDTLAVRTHNGAITVSAGEAGTDRIVVEAAKRAGGRDETQARACLDALRITTEKTGSTQNVGWSLAEARRSDWGVQVAFEITVPPRLAVRARSHNGRVTATGVGGDCDLGTHNGAVVARTDSPKLLVETHNGPVTVESPASQVRLCTHNGVIRARLVAAGELAGLISSHNGAVGLHLGPRTVTHLDCSTRNGSLRCSRELAGMTVGKGGLSGRLGEGQARLTVSTHNGSVRID